MKMKMLLAIILLALLPPVQGQYEINDLCLLIHSYEAPGINVSQLRSFLEEKGWKSKIAGNLVELKVGGKTIDLLPDGNGSNGLADFCDNLSATVKPQATFIGIEKLSVDDKVVKKYIAIADNDFAKKVGKVSFSTLPLGLCAEGTESLQKTFRNAGYNTIVGYNPATSDNQGHIWLVVLETEHSGIAIDSYYGIRRDERYYKPYVCLKDISSLYLVNPSYRIN